MAVHDPGGTGRAAIRRYALGFALIAVVALAIGVLVALGTAALLEAERARDLPGGSLAMGLTAGWRVGSTQKIPFWPSAILGAIAGSLGWWLATLFL
jgi:hypothetical protein